MSWVAYRHARRSGLVPHSVRGRWRRGGSTVPPNQALASRHPPGPPSPPPASLHASGLHVRHVSLTLHVLKSKWVENGDHTSSAFAPLFFSYAITRSQRPGRKTKTQTYDYLQCDTSNIHMHQRNIHPSTLSGPTHSNQGTGWLRFIVWLLCAADTAPFRDCVSRKTGPAAAAAAAVACIPEAAAPLMPFIPGCCRPWAARVAPVGGAGCMAAAEGCMAAAEGWMAPGWMAPGWMAPG